MTKKRMAITGLGAICGVGNTLDEVWQGLVAGKSGIDNITPDRKLSENMPLAFGGEVKNFTLDPQIMDEKEQKRNDRFIHLAMQAAHEALKNAGLLENHGGYNAERIGCIAGVGIGGLPMIEDQHEIYQSKGPRRISPFFIPGIITNMVPGLLSIKYGLKGINYTCSSACASAAHAITAAAYEILLDRHDVILAGGAESTLCNLAIGGFASMKALSKRTDHPSKASRPFDTGRDGFVMGEGAGFLVLEDLEKAKARGATIYGELAGFGASSDANHITAPHPEGLGALQCMKQSLDTAGISPDSIGYVNAHGTSTPLGDIAETKALRKTFGTHADKMFVSSTKSMTGHLLGAAGGLESVICTMAVHKGILPPTINLENQDPECDLDYIANQAKKIEVEYALNNSFGFGGTNSSLIIKKHS